ncbi:MAG: glycosyltransferase [Streptococcus sp.]|nr:glycosyltransferase [Streptococcus thermophilus]
MNNLIILDSELQRKNEHYYASLNGGSEVVFTNYETDLIRKVRNFKYVGSALYHLLMWKKSYDYARQFVKKDVQKIICLNPLVGIFLGVFNKRGKDITLAGFLFEEKKNKLYYNLRKVLVNKCLKNVKNVIVYSSKEVEYYSKIFPEFQEKFSFVHYGLDYEDNHSYEGSLPENFLFSGGGSNRDYNTIVKAVEKTKNSLPFVIATQPWRVPKHDEKITVLDDVVVETFGDVLGKSEALVLSLKDIDLSAGHMVMLQAMSLGVPIIVNDIPSVRDYVDESSVLFYKSGDFNQLASIIDEFDVNDLETIQRADKAKILYFNKYTSKKLMDRLIEI